MEDEGGARKQVEEENSPNVQNFQAILDFLREILDIFAVLRWK